MSSKARPCELEAVPVEPLVFRASTRWERRLLVAGVGVCAPVFVFLLGEMLWVSLQLLGTLASISVLFNGAPAGLSGYLGLVQRLAGVVAVMGAYALIPVAGLLIPVMVLLPHQLATLYLYPDRLTWSFLRRNRHVYFSGAERVRCGVGRIALRQEGVRIWLPFRMPDFERLHALLCERSEAFRRNQEVVFPFKLRTLRNDYAYGWIAVVALGGVLYAFSGAMGPEYDRDAMLNAAAAAVAALLLVPALLCLFPSSYRFEEDRICVRRLFGEKCYPMSSIVSLSALKRAKGLEIAFTEGRVVISQPMVRYPLSVLETTLRERYLGSPR